MEQEHEPTEQIEPTDLVDQELKSLEVSVHEGGINVAVSSYDSDFEEIKQVVQEILDGWKPSGEGSPEYIG